MGIIIAVLVGAFAIKHVVMSETQQSGYDVVLEELAALKENQVEKAYNLTSEQFRHATTFREFSRFVDRYHILRKNINAEVISQVVEDNMGSFKIDLASADKTTTRLDVDVIKEDGRWKVLHIMIKSPPAMSLSFSESLVDQFNRQPPKLIKSYDDKDNKYVVSYPDRWDSHRLDNGTVILSGKMGTRAYYSTINIQTILSKKSGGRFKTVKQLVGDIKKQVNEMAKNTIFLESGPYEIVEDEKKGAKAVGEYLIFTYTYNGYSYQQWSIILARDDGDVFYVWAYTSPQKQYTNDLPLAEAILKSWKIY